jgi:hypothetical protein
VSANDFREALGNPRPDSRRNFMRLKIPSLKRLGLLLFLVTPVAAWLIVKPVRVIAPSVMDVSCLSASVCVDDATQSQKAVGLYMEALAFVSETVAPIKGTPRVIFCFTDKCADSFGLGARSAVTLGELGTVIGPRAWKPYYVRHELIHYLQAERLGVFNLFFKPSWFVEGMAYGLSQDPRVHLAEPFEDYRKQFLLWYASQTKQGLWEGAQKL